MHTATRNSTAYGDALHVNSVTLSMTCFEEYRIPHPNQASVFSAVSDFPQCFQANAAVVGRHWNKPRLMFVVCLLPFGQYKLTLYVLLGYDVSVSKRFLAFRDSVVAWFLFQAEKIRPLRCLEASGDQVPSDKKANLRTDNHTHQCGRLCERKSIDIQIWVAWRWGNVLRNASLGDFVVCANVYCNKPR